MKIKSEHYQILLNAVSGFFEQHEKGVFQKIVQECANDKRVKNPDRAAKYNIVRVAIVSYTGLFFERWVCDNLYSYLNDDHIETAINSAFKKLGF